MKVLVADKFPENHLQTLKDNGFEVVYEPKLGENDFSNQRLINPAFFNSFCK